MSQPSGSIPFGVGCLYFAPTEPAPETGQSARYRELLREALEGIPNANNIEIEGGKDPDPRLLPLQGAWPSLDAPVFHAYPSFLQIGFDLYIPARIQEQILQPLSEPIVASEHFHVKLLYDDMPLMVATALETKHRESGSTYIILIREYLKRELDQSVMCLSCLGPSPFHSDFFLEFVQEQDRPLVVRREPDLGYSRHWCSYESRGHGDNARQALGDILWQFRPELRLFYLACRARMLRIRAWGEIAGPVRKYLLGGGRKRWRDAIAGRFFRSRSIRIVTERLIRFEMDGLFERQNLREVFDSTYSVPDGSYLRDEVDKAVKDLGEYPVDEVYRLIGFSEERRAKRMELIVVLLAAVVGGVVGGIGASLLGAGGSL